jgi:glycosyltransferase involved in cell wall biosynthesis
MPPLVSVLTPVYNGGKYLAECLDSVLSQTYPHWEYTIVNNASTDDTLTIAQAYAAKDSRIQVVSNRALVGLIENHNIAFRHISTYSIYTKVVSADDWLYPECIEAMVRLAEQNPTVGIVQAYVTNRDGIRWSGLPGDSAVIHGREASRLYLLGKVALAAPSGLLFCSDLVRSHDPFFPGVNPTADAGGCLRCLHDCDLGVVPSVLSYERLHSEAVTAGAVKLGRHLPDHLDLLCTYGPEFLSKAEFSLRLDEVLADYYAWLAAAAIHFRKREFWKYHSARMADLGFRLDRPRLAKAVLVKILDLLREPRATAAKIRRQLSPNVSASQINH